jgi:hypothetical protein
MKSSFVTYKTFLGNCNDDDFHDDAPSKPGLLIPSATDAQLRTYYAAFDYVNPDAQLVIVGITPGRTQMNKANRAAALAIQSGLPEQDVLLSAKKAASFGGEMKVRLTALLDHSNINQHLGILSCRTLWEQHNHLVHFTSVLRNPVFSMNGTEENNYTGSYPTLATYKGFATQRADLRNELLSINKKALILPLGAKVAHAIQSLVKSGAIPLSRVLNADGKVAEFAHPSGQNAETVNLSLTATPMASVEYSHWMLGMYLAKKQERRESVSSADKAVYLKKRLGYWNRDQHTRKALCQLLA